MDNQSKWLKLLSSQRLSNKSELDSRSPYLIDIDRITFSTQFRRLQDKTQVHPLAQSSYVRTRLTHSLEVATVGRSLGYNIGKHLIKKYQLKNITEHDFGYILQAACLAHDIGNPPFGHVSEATIINFFTINRNHLGNITTEEFNDLINFDGNSQGLRIISNLAGYGNNQGFKLTYATLGAFCKYPRSSQNLISKHKEIIGMKKSGILQTELSIFQNIAKNLDLIEIEKNNAWYRHPLAFLTEAADDICYSVADIEDGYATSLLSLKEVESLLIPLARNPLKYKGNSKERIAELRKESFYTKMTENQKIEFLRGKSISNLIDSTIEVFLNNEENILNGTFNNELLLLTPFKSEVEKCKEEARKKIYESNIKLKSEVTGITAIEGILTEFITTINNPNRPKSIRFSQLINYNQYSEISDYNKIVCLLDYICNTTDRKLVELYHHLLGL